MILQRPCLTPYVSYAIVLSAGGNGTVAQAASAAELDASLESLLASLSESVSAALQNELWKM